MRTIVIGIGEVGQNVARTLSAERHEVTVVDRDPVRVESMQSELDAMVLVGNGSSPKLLREIGVQHADLVCAVTESDEVNVIAALAARQLGAARSIARVRDPDYFGPDQSFARDVMGIDFIIQPERATAENLAAAIVLPGAVHVEHFAEGRVVVAESIVSERSSLLGKSLGERRMVRPHSILGIVRDGRVVRAEDGHRPIAGDHVLVAAAREHVAEVVAHVAGYAAEVRDVVVFGGGRIGLPLVRALDATGRFDVIVMERDAERARFVAERVDRATVLHEEGVDKDALIAHGVDQAGAFVACAGDDRANLLAALNAKQLGAGLCLAVVSREEFTPLVDALGIDAAYSPRLVTAEAILRAVRGGNVHAIHLTMGGAEVVEVEADDDCRAAGRSAGDAGTLAKTAIGAIVRDGRVLFPDERDAVRGGDRVLVFNARRGVADLAGAFKGA